MKFDILAESIINSINEGRLSKTEKYSGGIEFNSDKFKELVASKALDGLIETQVLSQKGFAGLSKEKVDEILTKVADDFSVNPPESFDDFKNDLTSIVDDFFRERGPRRAIYVGRLAKSLGNVILSNTADVVTVGSRTEKSGGEHVSSSQGTSEGKDLETSIINYIYASDVPTSKEDVANFVAHTFQKEEEDAQKIVNSLISSGVLEVDENGMVTAKEETSDVSDEEEFSTDDEEKISAREQQKQREAELERIEREE